MLNPISHCDQIGWVSIGAHPRRRLHAAGDHPYFPRAPPARGGRQRLRGCGGCHRRSGARPGWLTCSRPASPRSTRSGRWRAGTAPMCQPADFGPAVPEPPRILCLGVNYSEHAIEGGRAVPTWPEAFVRGPGSAIGPYEDLVKPALTSRFDYEGELGVVIGAGGRYLRAAEAMSAVAGFVVLNDATAREWQRAATQWTAGKNFEGTMPIGPGPRHPRRGRHFRCGPDNNAQRPGHAVGANLADDRRRTERDRVLLLIHKAQARRCHRDWHAGRGRLRQEATGLARAGRPDRGDRRGRRHDPQSRRRGGR